MIDVNAGNILDLMNTDWKKQFNGVPLSVSQAEEKAFNTYILKVNPVLVYAAWQYYLLDDWMHERGTPGIGQFLKHVNKYMARASRGMVKRDEMETVAFVPYSCEYGHAYGDDVRNYQGWMIQSKVKDWVAGQPEVHEDPCPVCGGRCLKMLNLIGRVKTWADYEGTPEHARTMARIRIWQDAEFVEHEKYEDLYNREILRWEQRYKKNPDFFEQQKRCRQGLGVPLEVKEQAPGRLFDRPEDVFGEGFDGGVEEFF